LLGSDAQGRDVLSRVLYGARLSLAVGLISQSVALLLGVTLGLVSGYYGRWMDGVIMRIADVTLAFPSLLLLIAIAAAVKPSLPVVFIVIGVVGWAGMARRCCSPAGSSTCKRRAPSARRMRASSRGISCPT
jgi:ABC-type dipeptide/oligopeptide/nickel transport system permease subunit